jgi:hypothetical protein
MIAVAQIVVLGVVVAVVVMVMDGDVAVYMEDSRCGWGHWEGAVNWLGSECRRFSAAICWFGHGGVTVVVVDVGGGCAVIASNDMADGGGVVWVSESWRAGWLMASSGFWVLSIENEVIYLELSYHGLWCLPIDEH